MQPTSSVSVPPAGEFVTAWIAYALHGLGLLLFWPSLIGLVINYSKVDSTRGGLVNSHHRWLIRTFWWASLGSLVAFVVLLAGLWPVVRDVIVPAAEAGLSYEEVGATLSIELGTLLTTLSAATLGALCFAATWLWILYRLVRGGFRLAAGEAAPLPPR